MPVEWRPSTAQLHLHNGRLSYVMRILPSGALVQLHVGAPLHVRQDYAHLERHAFVGRTNRVTDPEMRVLPTTGSGDFRQPALAVELADGSRVLDLVYREHHIHLGKPDLVGLPSTYVEEDAEAETVEVVLVDGPSGLTAHVLTTIFRDRPVIARTVRLVNGGTDPIALTTVMSATLDLPDADWSLLQHAGAWGRELHLHESRLQPGLRSAGSQRGTSGHQQNPVVVLRRPTTDEASGEAIGLALAYSGNFLAQAEVDPFGTARLRLGIDPGTFRWRLDPGDAFQSPEAILTWTDEGLGGISDAFHGLFRERLARGRWRDLPRPILLNSWEATYFDVREDRLVELASAARDLGIELFVLDDGWFGRRDDDTSSLGDWYVDDRKLPGGLARLAERVNALGLDLGLWIEPEMVNPRSDLFEAHPDWAIGIPGRPRSELRNQYVLDLSRPEVVDHLEQVIGAMLRSAPIAYVKWDMNRTITEPYSVGLPPDRQGELFHRFVLGVYDLYRRLTEAFPDILFESCASGGGRFDPGILAFAPQGWTSDDTDAIERLRIQWGASLAYPTSSIGAHVSAVPNHQLGRVTPIDTRAAVAFFGAFGYELDPAALGDDEYERVREQVAWYKRHRELFQYGRFLRLRGPDDRDGNETAWMSVAPERDRAVVGWYRVLARPLPGPSLLPLRGLDADARYAVTVWPPADDALVRANTSVRGGDELMRVGLFLDDHAWEAQGRGDFEARIFVLEALAT